MQRKLFFLACFFVPMALGTSNCSAQQYPIVYYTPRDGLVNSRIRRVKQDSKGRMLFITYSGLSIYDGARFINYTQQDGLANELVNDVVEITPDSLLVATNTQKLNTIAHGKIGEYKTADNFCPVVNRFFKSKDGQWYVTTDQGLFAMQENKFRRLPLVDAHGSDIGIYLDKIIEWRNFFIIIPWNIEQKGTMILYDKQNGRVRDVFTKIKTFDAVRDKSGKIWLSTSDGVKVLDTSAVQNGKINLLPPPSPYSYLSQKKNVWVFFDAENNCWFNDNGVIKIISPQLQVTALEQGQKASTLSDIFQDREGIIWIATDGNGVMKVRGTNVQLINQLRPGRLASFTAIHQQGDTTWLFNTAENTVCSFLKDKLQSFSLGEKMRVANIYTDNQKLYLGDEKKLLVVANKNESNYYRHPDTYVQDRELLFGNGLADNHGAIIQNSSSTDSFYLSVIKDRKIIMKYPMGSITDQLCIDRLGRLWAVSRNDHLIVFELHPEQPTRYLQPLKQYSKELAGLGPRALTIDKNDNIWIGTRYDGLYVFKVDGVRLTPDWHFTRKNGLTDNFIYTLSCDNQNNIWTGTQAGLDKISWKKDHYVIANVSKSNNFFQAIHNTVITGDNTVWSLTMEGSILKLSPGPTTPAATSPVLMFTSVKINDQPSNDFLNKFQYRQNNFSFTVAAPSFFDEKSIRYSYLLQGSGNNAWSESSNNSSFNFINLPPNRYILKIRADFPEGMYSPQTISYAFTILPPWWQTWWFRLAFAIMASAILVGSIRFYYRRRLEKERIILEKKQAIEKERTRIATDMHDDLGAGLSRIKFLSETIGIKKQQQQPIEEDISKIRQYSHEMIDKMGEIVWALNEKNDSLSDLLSYTRSYAVEYLSQMGIRCTINTPESDPSTFVSGEFRRNVFLTVKEALHNVVKHSQADAVEIKLQSGKKLVIEITDNGIGFARDSTRDFSNGLDNMQKRMNDIGGSLEIASENGTVIKLTCPLPL